MSFNEIKTFLQTYWRHVRNTYDIFSFLFGLIALVAGWSVEGYGVVGTLALLLIILIAMYRTWLFEHRRRVALENKNNSLNLSNIQKNILEKLNRSEYSVINISESAAGTQVIVGGSGSVSMDGVSEKNQSSS